jgi:hypothetical protein
MGAAYHGNNVPAGDVSIACADIDRSGGIMSLFDTLKNAIFGHAGAAASTPPTAPAKVNSPDSAAGAQPVAPNAAPAKPPASATGAAPQAQVDVEAVLNQLNAKSPQKLNWQTSIVDLMKLVGMDSSLQHRKELATELGYTGDANDSATMNIWLHAAVMQKLAANGGKVPGNSKG